MTKKIKYLLLLSFVIILGLCTKSQARITTDDPTVSSGENVTITIDSQEEVSSGAIDISSNGGLTFVSASGGQVNGTLVAFAGAENKTSGIATYTFKAPSVTKTQTFKVVFKSQDMANVDGDEVASSEATASVTVNAPKTNESDGNNNDENEQKPTSNGGTTTVTEPKFTKVNKTVYAKYENVNLRETWSTSSKATTIKKGTELTLTGTSTERIDNYIWYRVTYKGETKYISSTLVTTTKPEEKEEEKKSNDSSLKSLKVTPSELTPNFDSETKNYTLTIGSDIDDVEIEAVATDEKAEVKVSGNKDLEVGQNTIKIVVTAEDGTTRTYKIVVTKEKQAQLGLKELLVDGLSLLPKFEENVYNYTVESEDTDTKELNITATATRKDAEVEIVGNTDLKVGENNITIMVKADDGEIVTYQIAVTIKEPATETSASAIENNNNNSNDLKKYVVIAAAVLIVIAIIVIIISKREEASDDDGYDLQQLEDEDLPKSLRKNKKEETNLKEEIELPVEKDLKKQIDELMADDTNNEASKSSRKGKHF